MAACRTTIRQYDNSSIFVNIHQYFWIWMNRSPELTPDLVELICAEISCPEVTLSIYSKPHIEEKDEHIPSIVSCLSLLFSLLWRSHGCRRAVEWRARRLLPWKAEKKGLRQETHTKNIRCAIGVDRTTFFFCFLLECNLDDYHWRTSSLELTTKLLMTAKSSLVTCPTHSTRSVKFVDVLIGLPCP